MQPRANSTLHALLFVGAATLIGAISWLAGPVGAAALPVALATDDSACPLANRREDGQQVGPDECLRAEILFQDDDRGYRRIDLGLSGTARGFFVEEGARSAYFTSVPEFVFVQTGSSSDWQRGTVRYEAAQGAGLTLLVPEGDDWNGKLWLSVHGAGRNFRDGGLHPWDRRVPPDEPLRDISLYERSMLAKGYAVAKTFRSSGKAVGDAEVLADDGRSLAGFNITETPDIQLDWLRVAVRLLAAEHGREPERNYFYGHSAGGRNGRSINYLRRFNTSDAPWPRIDGFLIDDAGTGLWLPVLERAGRDVLLVETADRAAFAPQIDLTHQQYLRFKDEPLFERASRSYLLNKWENARILRDKGLGDRHRMYEVRGVSHSGGEYVGRGRRPGVEVIRLPRLVDALIDRLDEWVSEGVPAPPTRSDWHELDPRGAVALPEVACPLGVYYPYPPALGTAGVGTTGFAAYDGVSEEPLDGRGVFVDMNRNGFHDYRETLSAAWARLGLVDAGTPVTPARYVECVERAVDSLVGDRLLNPAVGRTYVQEAAARPLPSP